VSLTCNITKYKLYDTLSLKRKEELGSLIKSGREINILTIGKYFENFSCLRLFLYALFHLSN
jgi:hypothetical protein